eukprot:sb/3479555/
MAPYDTCPYLVQFKVLPGEDTIHLTEKTPESIVLLICEADGKGLPPITWHLKSGDPLPNGAKLENGGGELVLIRGMVTDEGVYICQVENEIGVPEATHDIIVSVGDRGPDSNATTDMGNPTLYRTLLLVVTVAVVLIIVVVVGGHCYVKRYNRPPPILKRDPAGYQVYHEQVLPPPSHHHHHQPVEFLEEQQSPFEWGQPGPSSLAYLMPTSRPILEEEPPPAYHADIELCPLPRASPQEHFFMPLQMSPDRPTPDHSTPLVRGPTPPPRSNAGSRNTQAGSEPSSASASSSPAQPEQEPPHVAEPPEPEERAGKAHDYIQSDPHLPGCSGERFLPAKSGCPANQRQLPLNPISGEVYPPGKSGSYCTFIVLSSCSYGSETSKHLVM